jgi:hypothetical protein
MQLKEFPAVNRLKNKNTGASRQISLALKFIW